MKTLILTLCILSSIYFGHWMTKGQYLEQVILLQKENKEQAQTIQSSRMIIKTKFIVCDNVMEKLGLMEQYKMAMGGAE